MWTAWVREKLGWLKDCKNINNCAWYNADFVRKYANDWDFEIEGRIRQSNRMKAFADFEKSQGRNVICDFVAPTNKVRDSFFSRLLNLG